jgi:hypothetical protein
LIWDIKPAYQQEKGQFPITSFHVKKCNKIGMVVVGLILENYVESRRSRWGCCCLGCFLELRGVRSFVSAMVFVWLADF